MNGEQEPKYPVVELGADPSTTESTETVLERTSSTWWFIFEVMGWLLIVEGCVAAIIWVLVEYGEIL